MQLPPGLSRPLRQWDPPDRRVLALWKQYLLDPGDWAPWRQRRSDPLDPLGQE